MAQNGPTPKQLAEAVRWASLLADRNDAFASESEDRELERWLAADPLHPQALDEVVQSWQAVDAAAGHPEIEAMRQMALGHAGGRRSATPDWWSRRWKQFAASIALLFAVGGIPLWYGMAPTTYATTIGERRVVTLDDGSRLSLDAETTVKTSYDKGRRMFWLEKGRAKFSAARDVLRPLTVTAGDKTIVANDTEFSVERIASQVRIILYKGDMALLERRETCACDVQIKLRDAHAAAGSLAPANEVILTNGLPAEGRNFVVASVNAERSLSWEAGMLSFKDEPLGQVVYRFNRYARKPLVVSDTDTAQLRISGTFDATDTNGLIEGLNAAFGVRAKENIDSVKLAI